VSCDDESLCPSARACSAGKCSEPFVAHDTRCDADLSTPDMGGTDVAFCREGLCQRRQVSVGGVKTCRLIENDVLCWFGGGTRACGGRLTGRLSSWTLRRPRWCDVSGSKTTASTAGVLAGAEDWATAALTESGALMCRGHEAYLGHGDEMPRGGTVDSMPPGLVPFE
jgi:hypothetical protein